MQAPRNYQRELEKIIDRLEHAASALPTLLLHSCCAPCSSYCMEYLRQYFRITVFYYNPNITEQEEYRKRVQEEIRLIEAYNRQAEGQKIEIIEGDYEPEFFLDMAKGLEQCAEGGERCFRCYELRLRKTAELARQRGFDYFTTTLTISPLKNAAKLNEIGERLAEEYGVFWLPSDFKKRGGYQRSIELSKEYDLYRQDYCGCVFSRRGKG
ncbi:MAG: epoxyqueuosine reductase QueH [Lachnospiraceae bacterium]|jgi:predicted adenine nucleotide alpha hydrolase (AANH) superfamily ATPase|nr:epoxyqueuosine reductase QueH [Lachnospiraceae bacterium]